MSDSATNEPVLDASDSCEEIVKEETTTNNDVAATAMPEDDSAAATEPPSGDDGVLLENKNNPVEATAKDDNKIMGTTDAPTHPQILALPQDALHAIASFLTPTEWCCQFGLLNHACCDISRKIITHIRMHAFKCATEVATAFKLGHTSDAAELVTVYLQEGVPIYPRSLGHAHTTLQWKLQVEAATDESDDFFRSRAEFRTQEGVVPQLTYLELKALYGMKQQDEGGPPATSPLQSPLHGMVSSRSQQPSSNDDLPAHPKKLALHVHQHLLDQHLLRRSVLADDNSMLVTPPISLSADFYHPLRKRVSSRGRVRVMTEELMAAATLEAPSPLIEDDLLLLDHPVRTTTSPFQDHPVLDLLDLEVYSKETTRLQRAGALQTQIDLYQRRLENCLKRGDNIAFEECLLDFWDEIFPSTAGFQYHDRHTAVPRISRLHEFLTKPCPKAVGTIQCEIERIKTTTKGVNVKGRLFPTYEYRLFIRNRPPEDDAVEGDFTRRDTVLMVARNRGRKHTESVVANNAAKKGSNNYFVYMPRQTDVDDHFRHTNESEEAARMVANGASHSPVLVSPQQQQEGALLGRLQSNFIGTEFQIYVPRLRKTKAQSQYMTPSDDEMEHPTSSERRSRFGRLSLRRSTTTSSNVEGVESIPRLTRAVSSPDVPNRRSNRRAVAHTPTQQQERQREEEDDCQQQERMVLCEEEDGCITYTANLLGSRPRIMDVCVPNVSPDGVVGAKWKCHLEQSSCDQEDAAVVEMLSSFRQLLQHLEDQEDDEPIEDYGLLALQNRPPWWNVVLGSFVLNFGGRVSVASVKNFQLCARDDQDTILLQFGRIQGRHSFTMDFQYPLSAVQAFSIAISSLQSKISFG